MASIIKKRLKELCDQNSSLATLWAQWTFDEKLISKALNSVGQTFPHYSLHDSSHSNQIVTNIERIIGNENINKLSATDLWLILEAAFCHDIGMIIPMDKITKDWDSPDFKEHMQKLTFDDNHELKNIAIKYKQQKCEVIFENSIWPIATFEEIRLLLADFYRRKHADRSEDIINNPWNEIALTSPRNELLPTRLFKTLGKVCAHHGYSFEEVMSLPNIEVGIANDDAHPRYVACLLRLGDLLDLDDNRFCPVMLKTAGKLPLSTKAHIDKHMSIEHFRMDQNRIEVHALCETYDGYAATSNWFEYLRTEISQQMMHWDDIVPDKSMGLLPTIGKLDIQLNGFDLLGKNQLPKFDVDNEKIFDILQGSGLYDRPHQCIREILQNAADTTLLKYWCDHKRLKKTLYIEEPRAESIKDINEYYSISVNINKLRSNDSTIDWEVTIQDKGMGISKEGLVFLQKVGSSNKDWKKRSMIEGMPLWLQPSGAFGIGFQSIFLITEKVIITSKDFYSGQAIYVELTDPTIQQSGNILIKELKESYKVSDGTSIKIIISEPKCPTRFSYSSTDKIITSEISNYDFIESEELNVEILKLVGEIQMFSENSYVPVNLTFENHTLITNHNKFEKLDFEYFDGIGVRFGNGGGHFSGDNLFQSSIYFKGQPLETDMPTSFILFDIDLIKYKASDILEVNRNKIKKDEEHNVKADIAKAICKYCINVIDRDEVSCSEKEYLKALLMKFSPDNYALGIPMITLQETTVTVEDIVNAKEVVLEQRTYKHTLSPPGYNARRELISKENDVVTISLADQCYYESVKFVINTLINKHFKGIKFSSELDASDESKTCRITYTKVNECDIDLKDVCHALLDKRKNYERWPRAIMFCPDKYKHLAVRNNSVGFSENLNHTLSHYISAINYEYMVLPFKASDESLQPYHFDSLVNWVYAHKFNEGTTLCNIREQYKEFIDDVKKTFQNIKSE